MTGALNNQRQHRRAIKMVHAVTNAIGAFQRGGMLASAANSAPAKNEGVPSFLQADTWRVYCHLHSFSLPRTPHSTRRLQLLR